MRARTAKMDHWQTSEQKQRWCAATLLLIEPRLRKVKGIAICRSSSRRCARRTGLRHTSRRRPHVEAPPEAQREMGLTLDVTALTCGALRCSVLNNELALGCILPSRRAERDPNPIEKTVLYAHQEDNL